jgi:hypothetical protein
MVIHLNSEPTDLLWVDALTSQAVEEGLEDLARYLNMNRIRIAELRGEVRKNPPKVLPTPFIYTLR